MLLRTTIKNFRSIVSQDVHLGPMTVLVGANGTGKSNFLRALSLMGAIGSGRLQREYSDAMALRSLLTDGDPDLSVLIGNPTGELSYQVVLRTGTHPWRFKIVREQVVIDGAEPLTFRSDKGVNETRLLSPRFITGSRIDARTRAALGWLRAELASWTIHGAHAIAIPSQALHAETGARARSRVMSTGSRLLDKSGRNLSAVLRFLKEDYPEHYEQIRDVVRQALPAFGDWRVGMHDDPAVPDELWWYERGSRRLFSEQALSPGQFRMPCSSLVNSGKPSGSARHGSHFGFNPANREGDAGGSALVARNPRSWEG